MTKQPFLFSLNGKVLLLLRFYLDIAHGIDQGIINGEVGRNAH